jgi:hypothetical protein
VWEDGGGDTASYPILSWLRLPGDSLMILNDKPWNYVLKRKTAASASV